MFASTTTARPTRFLWLEITGKCPLECTHCYADSGPTGSTGEMTEADWLRVIDQAADAGVTMVQFIGGEPISHPSLSTFITHALAKHLKVEVFTNLAVLPNKLKEVLTRPGVQLATSYYSSDPDQHDAITCVKGSHRRTTGNIAKVKEWGVPLRVGVIQVSDDQDVAGAYKLLESMGVTEAHIGFDRLREVGRGIREENASYDQLCGNCGNGNAAILPSGDVVPCVFSRWMEPVGNVLEQPLGNVLSGSQLSDVRAELRDFFAMTMMTVPHTLADECRPMADACNPQCNPGCAPDLCDPSMDYHDTRGPSACNPDNAECAPHYVCVPTSGEPGYPVVLGLPARG